MSVNSLGQTPNASRLHIGIFGRRNHGKSSLINAITGRTAALVSDFAGTTTDPVYQAMELYPIGPCVLMDTAGFDDNQGELGAMRVKKTRECLLKTDLALIVLSAQQTDLNEETAWIEEIQKRNIPLIFVVNQTDLGEFTLTASLPAGVPVCFTNAVSGEGIALLKDQIVKSAPKNYELESITGHLVKEGDSVLLVMPQDIQAPKGRLILPQVQVTRDLLDHHAVITSVSTNQMELALSRMTQPPKLIITDSQVFPYVAERCPKESKLTSFSVLLARYKGDIEEFLKGAQAVETLTPKSRVLILEACSHNPLDGDIGRVKIPALLRKKVGQELSVEVRSGNDIPEDLTPYDLVVHCGGCMFNRAHVLSRVARCREQGVPITNYGILIAKLTGILEKVTVM
ncbi:MAG: [FeFe] hydrogenase H-cluster maturation GTPase HydF [Massiliimalia sp.]